MMDMNILICDDIQKDAIKLENAINEAGFDVNFVYFKKGADVLEYIKNNTKIDVCFLDIIMPEMNGIEIAANMRAVGFNGKIVFLTTSKDYGVESYQVKAYHYLLKPVNSSDIVKLLNEIKNSEFNQAARFKQRACIKIETRNVTRLVYYNEISFVEVINKNVFFRLSDGSDIVIFASLSEILPQLIADGRFAQCHRSFMVNMDAITQIRGKEIFLRCGRMAVISRNYKEFSNQYLKHIFEGEEQNSKK